MDEWSERALRPAAELISGFSEFIGQVGEAEHGFALTVEEVQIELPVELAVESGADGTLNVLVTPPERTVTSFTPTLSALRIRVALEEHGP